MRCFLKKNNHFLFGSKIVVFVSRYRYRLPALKKKKKKTHVCNKDVVKS